MGSRVHENHNTVAITYNLSSFSLLPTLSMNAIIFSAVHEGTYNGLAFVHYIQQLLQHMNPWPEANSVLVMC